MYIFTLFNLLAGQSSVTAIRLGDSHPLGTRCCVTQDVTKFSVL